MDNEAKVELITRCLKSQQEALSDFAFDSVKWINKEYQAEYELINEIIRELPELYINDNFHLYYIDVNLEGIEIFAECMARDFEGEIDYKYPDNLRTEPFKVLLTTQTIQTLAVNGLLTSFNMRPIFVRERDVIKNN